MDIIACFVCARAESRIEDVDVDGKGGSFVIDVSADWSLVLALVMELFGLKRTGSGHS